MSLDRGQPHIYDLDPPSSTIRRVAGGFFVCALLGLFFVFLWFLLAPEPATGASSPAPVVDSIVRLCGQSSIPRFLGGIADLALPLWSTVCNVVQD